VSTSGVGTYAITGSTTGLSASNYDFTAANGTLTITQRPITVTAAAKSKTYGDADPALTYTLEALGSGRGLVAGDVFTGSLSRTAGETVSGGPYAITLGSVGNSNYSVSYTGADLTISARPITLTATGATRVYGDADPALSVSVSGGSLGSVSVTDALGDVTGTLSRQAGASVGNYDIALGTGSKAGNYAITYLSDNNAFSITQRPITVTAAAKGKTYGDADPALTYTLEALGSGRGLVAGDVFTGSLSRTAGETVSGGPYAITLGSVGNSNYSVSYTGADLTINPATLLVAAISKSKIYGDADPALAYGYSGLVNDDQASVLTGSLSRTTGENVGDYAIDKHTLSAGSNYTISYTDANLTINPATLTVSANSQNKMYGNSDPGLSYQVSGFKLNDGASVLTGSLARTDGENVGSYTIDKNTLSAGNNYTISYTPEKLTITPAALMVVSDNQASSGTANPAVAQTIAATLNGESGSIITNTVGGTGEGNTANAPAGTGESSATAAAGTAESGTATASTGTGESSSASSATESGQSSSTTTAATATAATAGNTTAAGGKSGSSNANRGLPDAGALSAGFANSMQGSSPNFDPSNQIMNNAMDGSGLIPGSISSSGIVEMVSSPDEVSLSSASSGSGRQHKNSASRKTKSNANADQNDPFSFGNLGSLGFLTVYMFSMFNKKS
jgi:hypothetical protein